MSNGIRQFNEGAIKNELKRLVRNSVEETLNGLLEREAQRLAHASKYERTEKWEACRSGSYAKKLGTTSGEAALRMPKLKGVEIERCRRREIGVEEALIEMRLAGVSARRVEDITEALWGGEASPSTVNEMNKRRAGT
jgi:transposase-like protein